MVTPVPISFTRSDGVKPDVGDGVISIMPLTNFTSWSIPAFNGQTLV